MEPKKKQERTVVHLEKDGQHYYYGNLKALTDHWNKDAIGVSYTYLKNLNISEDKPYRNDKCIIRKGILTTSNKNNIFVVCVIQSDVDKKNKNNKILMYNK